MQLVIYMQLLKNDYDIHDAMLNKIDKKIDIKSIIYNTPSSLCVISSMCFNLASSLTLVAYSSL